MGTHERFCLLVAVHVMLFRYRELMLRICILMTLHVMIFEGNRCAPIDDIDDSKVDVSIVIRGVIRTGNRLLC